MSSNDDILSVLIKYFEDKAWDVYKHDWDGNGKHYTGAYLQDANEVVNLDELADWICGNVN